MACYMCYIYLLFRQRSVSPRGLGVSCIRLFMYNVTCTHFSEIKNYLSIYLSVLENDDI